MNDVSGLASRTATARIMAAGIVVGTFVALFYSVSFQIGDMLAFLTPSTDENAASIADMANTLAPSDPLAAYLKASTADEPNAALDWFQRTVQLSPRDYHWRVELARAYEQAGRESEAKAEFEQAIDLAPNYAYPHWHYGNFLLRRNQIDDALGELKKAASDNHLYRDQVFALAWDVFDKDPKKLRFLAGDSDFALAQLAFFLGTRGDPAAAFDAWNAVSPAGKERFFYYAEPLAPAAVGRHAFLEALGFSKQLGHDLTAKPEAVTNGSFEEPLSTDDQSLFGWGILRNEPKVEIVQDGKVKHSGDQSLRVTFKGFDRPNFANVFQTVVVDPGQKYSLGGWVRTENLKSAGGPVLEVLNANDNSLMGRSGSFVPITGDWQQISINFTAPPDCHAVIVRTSREECGAGCPITGSFWYDDFGLQKQ